MFADFYLCAEEREHDKLHALRIRVFAFLAYLHVYMTVQQLPDSEIIPLLSKMHVFCARTISIGTFKRLHASLLAAFGKLLIAHSDGLPQRRSMPR